MSEPHTVSDAGAEPGSNAPAACRLVIRAQIIQDLPPETVQRHWHGRARAWIVGGLAALLVSSWMVISVFRGDSPSAPAANEPAQNAQLQSAAPARTQSDAGAPALRESPPPTSEPASAAAASSIDARSIESQPVEPLKPTHEVVPEVPRSALQTIRGTIRVVVRVSLDKQGAVIDASSEEPGPSRYFERLSLEASRKWSFTPTATDEPRSTLVRFHFKRDGATARASARE